MFYSAPSVAAAFFAGLLSFLSPCIFPLIPGYISFITGESLDTLKNIDNDDNKKRILRLKALLGAAFFGLGFSVVFVLLGAASTAIGTLLRENQIILSRIAGIIVIIFGLHMVGLFKIKFLMREAKITYKRHSFFFFIEAFLLGITFVLGWTPCIGPILTAILALASQSSELWHGILLLSFYSLGLWIPFLITALLINRALVFIRRTSKYVIWVERVAGILLIIMGFILLFNKMTALTSILNKLFSFIPVLG